MGENTQNTLLYTWCPATEQGIFRKSKLFCMPTHPNGFMNCRLLSTRPTSTHIVKVEVAHLQAEPCCLGLSTTVKEVLRSPHHLSQRNNLWLFFFPLVWASLFGEGAGPLNPPAQHIQQEEACLMPAEEDFLCPKRKYATTWLVCARAYYSKMKRRQQGFEPDNRLKVLSRQVAVSIVW